MPIGLDIGSHAIKALAVRRVGGKFQVVGATRVRRASVDSDESRFPMLTKELYSLFTNARVHPKECIVGLTGRDLNLRFVQLPPVAGKGDLRQMIGFEVTQIIGRGGAEIYSDYAVLDIEEKYPEISLLLAMSKRSLAEDLHKTCVRSGIDVKDLTPNAIGLFTAYRNAGVSKPGEVTLLLDIGAENTDLVLVRDGKLLFARNISTGAKVFTDAIQGALKCSASKAEERKIRDGSLVRGDNEPPGTADIRGLLFNAVGPLQSTIQSSMQFARAQMKLDLDVGRILVSGGGARLRGFPEYLASVLGKPVERFNPFAGTDLSRLSPPTATELSSVPTDFAVALGLAQLACESSPATTLSLLPDPVKKARSFWKQGLWLAGAAASALIGLGALFAGAWHEKGLEAAQFSRLDTRRKELQTRAAEADSRAAERDTQRARATALVAEKNHGALLLRAISLVRQAAPEGVWVSQIDYSPYETPDRSDDAKRPPTVVVAGTVQETDQAPRAVMDLFKSRIEEAAGDLTVEIKKFDKVDPAAATGPMKFEIWMSRP